MASSDKDVEEQLLEAGNKIVDPPTSVEELLPLLDVSPSVFLLYVFQPVIFFVWEFSGGLCFTELVFQPGRMLFLNFFCCCAFYCDILMLDWFSLYNLSCSVLFAYPSLPCKLHCIGSSQLLTAFQPCIR